MAGRRNRIKHKREAWLRAFSPQARPGSVFRKGRTEGKARPRAEDERAKAPAG